MLPFHWGLLHRLCVVGFSVLGCARSDTGAPPLGPAAAHAIATPDFRWRVVEVPDRGVRLYLQIHESADLDARPIVDSIRSAQADVLALLEEPLVRGSKRRLDHRSDETALFVVASRDDMRRLSGRPLAGFVQPGEATAFFVWMPGYRAPFRHELAHLYTFERWGRPPAGEAATWLVEGIGAWAGGPCQGHSVDALAAGLLVRGALPSPTELAEGFRVLPEDVALPTAGSLTQYLHAREGIAGLRARWRSGMNQLLPDSTTIAAWRAHLASVRPAVLDIGRVMQEGC